MHSMKVERTLILTSGTYAITDEIATSIVTAIHRGDTMISVPIDLYCDGSNPSPVQLMIRHVVAIVEHERNECDIEIDNPKVRRLRG
jgi:Ni,Fe-hydrogenase III small subunit